MKINIADIKAHVLAFLQREQLAVEAAEHKMVQRFVQYVESKQTEVDAASYLRSLGYTVTSPAVGSLLAPKQ